MYIVLRVLIFPHLVLLLDFHRRHCYGYFSVHTNQQMNERSREKKKKIVAHRKRMWCKPSENPFHSNSEPSAWVFFYYPSHWYGTCCCIFHDNYLNLFISTFVFISFFLYLCLSFFFVFGLRSCWFFFLLFLQPLQLYDRLVLARFFLSPKHGCRSFLGNSTIESNGIFRCTKALNSMVFSLLSLSLCSCVFSIQWRPLSSCRAFHLIVFILWFICISCVINHFITIKYTIFELTYFEPSGGYEHIVAWIKCLGHSFN